MVRLDSTVTAALMHEPSDSSLLWDAVRVMVESAAHRACGGRRAWALVARSSAGSEEARPGDPVHPRATQTGSAVPRADQPHSGNFGLSASGGGAAGHPERSGGRALAGQAAALSATDRAESSRRASSESWRASRCRPGTS
jgi:hypothetical protein